MHAQDDGVSQQQLVMTSALRAFARATKNVISKSSWLAIVIISSHQHMHGTHKSTARTARIIPYLVNMSAKVLSVIAQRVIIDWYRERDWIARIKIFDSYRSRLDGLQKRWRPQKHSQVKRRDLSIWKSHSQDHGRKYNNLCSLLLQR